MPNWIQRALLGVVFIVVGVIEFRFTIMTIDVVANWQTVPRLPAIVDPVTLAITDIFADGLKKAGAQVGDVVVAEAGEPIHSFLDAPRVLFRHQIGDRFNITLRRKNSPPFVVDFVIPPRERQGILDYVMPIVLNILTPWSCICLAALVALRRAGDPVAYALITLLLCMSVLLQAEGAPRLAWGPWFTWPMLMIDQIGGALLPAAWLWFALLFPDPKSRFIVLPRVAWWISIPYCLNSVFQAVQSTAQLHQAGELQWVPKWANAPGWLVNAAMIILISLGFANFVYKLIRETELTMGRRLRWMLFGLTLGVLPVVVTLGLTTTLHYDINRIPLAVLTPIVISPIFVPITLAYAVLVDRLFDVGLFFRQGLLATKTIAIVRVLLIGALVLFVISVENRKDIGLTARWTISLLCVAAALLIRRLADWTRRWVDRHFFQEAVNTEHLLVELSAEVRRIADPAMLLRTVTERISSAMHVSRVAALIPNGDGFMPAFATGTTAVALTDPLLRQLRDIKEPLSVSGDLFLPIGTGADLQGILSLGPKRSEEPYSGGDIRLLESVANQTALALENSRLTATVAQEAAQRERITSELEIARQVQLRLFPKAPPKIVGLDLAGHCQPAQTVGGDYYDFLITPSGGLGLAIGDVAGKGIPAALLMAGLQASLRGLTLARVSDPADLMGKLNQLVFDATPVNRFATFFYGLYDVTSRSLLYSSAGHNPVLLYRASTGRTEWLKMRGVGLGLSRASKYEQLQTTLEPSDLLVLYTDGITEARNEKGEEFGEDRLIEIVRSTQASAADEVLETILRATTAFAGAAPQFDDLTLIVAKVGG